ncbi:MAG: hypothetical protein C4518_18425 [Desulfobacteraceae bacterium]|nr:MAG: hypothetical protein C4518_18425 [Desulfobacteraceae bacterium]
MGENVMKNLDNSGTLVAEEYPGELITVGYERSESFSALTAAIEQGRSNLAAWRKAGAFNKYRRFSFSALDVALFIANGKICRTHEKWTNEDIEFLVANQFKVTKEGARYRLFFVRLSDRDPEWVRRFNSSLAGQSLIHFFDCFCTILFFPFLAMALVGLLTRIIVELLLMLAGISFLVASLFFDVHAGSFDHKQELFWHIAFWLTVILGGTGGLVWGLFEIKKKHRVFKAKKKGERHSVFK